MNLHKKSRIGIWGYAIVGKAAARYFHEQGYALNVMDKRTLDTDEISELQQKNIHFYSESDKKDFFYFSDYIFSSPGINIALDYATHKNKWLHELDLFSALMQKPIIAATGSIGKTSVTHMLAALLRHANINACVGGNIGTATFDLLDQKNVVDYALLEVSSFQLQYCQFFAPHLAIWTNFYPNHLDHHADEEEYFLAKQKIFLHQKTDQSLLINFALRNRVQKNNKPIFYFTKDKPTAAVLSQLTDNEYIYYQENDVIIRYHHKNITPMVQLNEPCKTFSFIENIILITAAADILNINPEIVLQIPHNTQLPAHRLENVGIINNVDFYNDSKSTTITSTLAAVEKLKHRPLHLFLGGLSKGVNRESLIAQLRNTVTHIYCFGKEAETLHSLCLRHLIPATKYINLEDAFNTCLENVQPHDIVLLSPAGSSYDLYNNFEERGTHFKNLVKKMTE